VCAAFLWQANPNRWTGSGSLESYIADESGYVYWSTPPEQCRHDRFRIGDRAYLWRTRSNSGPRGIIAIGTVAELPKQLLPGGEPLFARPKRLASHGDEHAASSEWKTGIVISDVRLRAETGMLTHEVLVEVLPRLARGAQGTVFEIDDDQNRRIERMWAERGPGG
jgi:hypothetical protein